MLGVFLISITLMGQKRVFQPPTTGIGLTHQVKIVMNTVDSLVKTWERRRGQHNTAHFLLKATEDALIEHKPKEGDSQYSHNEWRAITKEIKTLRWRIEHSKARDKRQL